MITIIRTVLEKVSSGNLTLKDLSQQLPDMSYKNITVDDCGQFLIQCEIIYVDSNYLKINYAVDVDLFASILVMYQDFVKKISSCDEHSASEATRLKKYQYSD